ncbi:DUF4355 domain-containing protein [Lysinibacillus sp. SGAir0095]|uniref:DUF4355 domain-containing protein n=1 Tax=Lysinibacillus sp. SGAir0095 TaxID=2070463 RepID=UPI0010CD20CC|nr:DUF4355 domain-containing protein [Lysinibacillus sp. SGAir0095]QCR33133.1 hypothetical protein C1N55_13495 [Lysinibacillus sp. SGAir0095]
MIIDLEQVKTLAESGDKSALEQYIFKALEKGDVESAVKVNAAVNSELDSLKDTHHTKALETWKTNHLQGLIDDAVSKANPQETPEQKRIRELEEKILNSEKATKLAELKAKALEHATSKGLPNKFATKYIERFLGDDETVTASTLDELKTDLDEVIQAQVQETLKGNARGVGGGTGSNNSDSYGKKLAQTANDTTTAAEAQSHYFK